MDTKSVWEVLAGIPVGTIVAWVSVIAAIIVGICTGTIKLYRLFTKYKNVKDENEEQKKIIQQHDELLARIHTSLKEIKSSLCEQKEVNMKQIRHTIFCECDEAISSGKISVNKLKSLEEMYEEYREVFHGNGSVKIMMEKTRELPVVGRLDI